MTNTPETNAAGKPPCRVIVTDDQAVLRELLSAAIVRMPGLKLVAQCGTGMEAVQACLAHKPDLLVLDILLPDMSGIEVARMVRRGRPEIKILAMTGMEDDDLFLDVINAGVQGFVFKTAAFAQLSTAIQEIISGNTYYYKADLNGPLRRVPKSTRQGLTSKEVEVLKLLAQGYKAKEAADKLGCSVRTVDNHRANIMRKLDLHDIVTLTRYAIRRGLVSP